MCVKNAKSKWIELQRGVPQGSILGPLLFIVYVNDLPQVIQNSAVTQYSDDTTMTLVANDVNSLERKLDEDLQHVMKWADDNKLKMNTRKTQLLPLSRKRREREMCRVRVSMNNEVIERSRSVKCLGVKLDDGLNWKEQVQSVRGKCFAGLGKLRRLRDVLQPKTKKQIYSALVQPHLDYCSVVWQECSRELRRSLERMQNYGMRLILSKPPRTPSEQLRKELEWKTLEERWSRSRLYVVHKCVTGQAPASLCRRVEVNTRNTQGWAEVGTPQADN